jgi:hypothetical protein
VPAIGAAVHGIRTQSEFRRHCQRYQRMAGLLRQLDADMSRAVSITVIHKIAADAEHLMRAENSDWFGVMRFHDVELITLTRRAPAHDHGIAGWVTQRSHDHHGDRWMGAIPGLLGSLGNI